MEEKNAIAIAIAATTTTTKTSPKNSPTSGDVKQDGNDTSEMTISEPLVSKRNRGRPKKNVNDVAISRSAPPKKVSTETIKRSRGRPKGSRAKPSNGLEQSDGDFSAHNFVVLPGEDIVRRVMTISQNSPRSMCILSAAGSVSTAIIRQHSGLFFKYEGLFQIIKLSGMFVMVNASGIITKTSKLCASLITPDGIVFGGASVASLIAADHVHLILGSFKQDEKNSTTLERPGAFKPEELMVGPDDLIGAPVVSAPNFSDDEPLTEDDNDVIYDANPISIYFPPDPTTAPNQPSSPDI